MYVCVMLEQLVASIQCRQRLVSGTADTQIKTTLYRHRQTVTET